MPRTTLPFEKYHAALDWCYNNRYKLPAKCKFKQMHAETLYALLSTLRVLWDKNSRQWYEVAPQSKSVQPSKLASTVLVRLICDKSVAENRTSEFMELCEAIGWNVVKVGQREARNSGKAVLIYIKVEVDK